MTRYISRPLITLLAMGMLILTSPVSALDNSCRYQFAGKDLRVILANKPGGSIVRQMEMIADHFEKEFDARMVLDSQPGGKGLVAVNKLLQMNPDGFSIGFFDLTTILQLALDKAKPRPELLEKLVTVGRARVSQYMTFVAAESPIESVDDFFAQDKEWVLGMNHARQSGSVMHRLLAAPLGYDHPVVTGFKSGGDRVLAVARGDIDYSIASYKGMKKYYASGEVKPLLVYDRQPVVNAPDMIKVPYLFGEGGVAYRQLTAREVADMSGTMRHLDAIHGLMQLGFNLVAPTAIPAEQDICLQAMFEKILTDPVLLNQASLNNLAISYANRERVNGYLEADQSTLGMDN